MPAQQVVQERAVLPSWSLDKDVNSHFSKEDTAMAKKHRKRMKAIIMYVTTDISTILKA